MVGKVNTYNIRKRNIEQGLSYTTTARRFSNLLTVTIDIMSEKCSHQFSMPNPSAVVVNRKTIEKDYCSPRCVSVLLFILLRFRSSKTIIVKQMYVLTTSILHVAKKKNRINYANVAIFPWNVCKCMRICFNTRNILSFAKEIPFGISCFILKFHAMIKYTCGNWEKESTVLVLLNSHETLIFGNQSSAKQQCCIKHNFLSS